MLGEDIAKSLAQLPKVNKTTIPKSERQKRAERSIPLFRVFDYFVDSSFRSLI